LAGRFALKGQFSQQVRIAQTVRAQQSPIRPPAVVHRRAHQIEQDAVLFEGSQATLGMCPIPGQLVARHRMQPVQTAGHAQARFVGMHHRQVNQQLGNAGHFGPQQLSRLIAPRMHRRHPWAAWGLGYLTTKL
jgi:hypothetical protein